LLIFDSHATIGKNDLYRDQNVRVEMNIPVGTRLIIDNEIRHRIYNLSFDEFDDDYDDQPKPRQSEWLMTVNGLEYIRKSQGMIAPSDIDSLNTYQDSLNTKIDTVLKK